MNRQTLSNKASRAIAPRLHPWALEYLSRVCGVELIRNTNRHIIDNADNNGDTSVTKRGELVSSRTVMVNESLPDLQKVVNDNNVKCHVVNNNNNDGNVNMLSVEDENNTINEKRHFCSTHLDLSDFESCVKQQLFDHLHWRLETRLIRKQDSEQNKCKLNQSNNNNLSDTSDSRNEAKILAQEVKTPKDNTESRIKTSTLQSRSNETSRQTLTSSPSSQIVSLKELNDMLIKMLHHRKDVFVNPAVGCATMVFVCNQIISSIVRHAMQFAKCKVEELHQQKMSALSCVKETSKEEVNKEVNECVHNTKPCITANSINKVNESNENKLETLQKKVKTTVEVENSHRTQERQSHEVCDNNKSYSIFNCNDFSSNSYSNSSECIEYEEEDDSVRLHVIAARYTLHALTLPAVQTELRKTLWGAAQSLHRKIIHECKVNLLHAARRELVVNQEENKIIERNFTANGHIAETKFVEGIRNTANNCNAGSVNSTSEYLGKAGKVEQASEETINKTPSRKTYHEIQKEQHQQECEETKRINNFLWCHYKLSLEQLIDDLFSFPTSLYNITPERLSDNESRLSVSLHNSDKMLFYPPLHRIYFDFTTRSTLLCMQMRKPRVDKLLPLHFATSANVSHGTHNTKFNNLERVKEEHYYNYNNLSKQNYSNNNSDKKSKNEYYVEEWRDTLWVSLCQMSQLRICISFLLQLEYILFDAKNVVNCSFNVARVDNKISTNNINANVDGSSNKNNTKQEEYQNKEQNRKESFASITKVNGIRAIDCVLRLMKLLNARLDGHLWKETHFKRFCRKCQVSEKSELSCISAEEEEQHDNAIDKENNFTLNSTSENKTTLSNNTDRIKMCNDKEREEQHLQIHEKIKVNCNVKTQYASVQELHTAFMHAMKGNLNKNNNDTSQSNNTTCNGTTKEEDNTPAQKSNNSINVIDDNQNKSNEKCSESNVANKMFVNVRNDVHNAGNSSKLEQEKSLELQINQTSINVQTNTTATHNVQSKNDNEKKSCKSAMDMQQKQNLHEPQLTEKRQQSKQAQDKITIMKSRNNDENCNVQKTRDDLFLEEIMSSSTQSHTSWPPHFSSKHSSRQIWQSSSSPSVTPLESQKETTSAINRTNSNKGSTTKNNRTLIHH